MTLSSNNNKLFFFVRNVSTWKAKRHNRLVKMPIFPRWNPMHLSHLSKKMMEMLFVLLRSYCFYVSIMCLSSWQSKDAPSIQTDSNFMAEQRAPHTSGSQLEKPWVYSWGFDFLLWFSTCSICCIYCEQCLCSHYRLITWSISKVKSILMFLLLYNIYGMQAVAWFHWTSSLVMEPKNVRWLPGRSTGVCHTPTLDHTGSPMRSMLCSMYTHRMIYHHSI